MSKKLLNKLLSVLLVLSCFVNTTAFADTIDDTAKGADFSVIYDDDYTRGFSIESLASTWGTSSSAKVGTQSMAVFYNPDKTSSDGRIYTGRSYVRVQDLDFENDAVQFWYNPRYSVKEVYIGLVSQAVKDTTSSTGRDVVSMLRLSLSDYIDLPLNSWTKVSIPLKYFIENGEFDSFRSTDTEFAKYTTCGVVFEYSIDTPPTTRTTLAYVDELKFIRTVAPPTDLSAYTDFSAVTINWQDNSGKVTEFDIYKNDALVATQSDSYTYQDSGISDGDIYRVRTRTTDSSEISVAPEITVSLNQDYSAYTSGGTRSISELVYAAKGSNATIMWTPDKSVEYLIYKNNTLYGRSTGGYFTDNAYSTGDTYRVAAVDDTNKILYTECTPSAAGMECGKVTAQLTYDTDADKISGTVYNFTSESKPVTITAAIFDLQTKRFINAENYKLTVPVGKKSVEIPMNYCAVATGEFEVKLIAVESYTTMKPIIDEPFAEIVSNTEIETNASITINSEDYQPITGWGVVPTSINANNFETFSNISDWPELYDKLYSELGITTIRVPFDETCCDAETGAIVESALDLRVKYIKNAMEYGINDYMITYWTPPACWIHQKDKDGKGLKWYLTDGYEDEYAGYIVQCLQYLKSNGVPLPKVVSFQNEPESGSKYPTYDIDQYTLMAVRLRQALDSAQMTDVKILAPETVAYYAQYKMMGGYAPDGGNIDNQAKWNYYESFSKTYDDIPFYKAIGVFGVHSYLSVKNGSTNADIEQFEYMTNIFRDARDFECWMTEFSGLSDDSNYTEGGIEKTDHDMGSALFTMRILTGDVGWAGMNRWYYWHGYVDSYVMDDNNQSYDKLLFKRDQQTLVFGQQGFDLKNGKLYDALKTLFNNVPIGSVVKRTECTDSDFVNTYALRADILAFETPNGGSVVVLSNSSTAEKSIDFKNVSGTNAKISYITGDASGITTVSKAVSGNTVENVYIPPRSITYVVTN